jgi:SAM-dependent methyltransferase
MATDEERWEDIYLATKPEALPWNAGKPDPDLVRLVESGAIPAGQALDVGTGPGHDAVYLMRHGFNVIAIDISPSAVLLARQAASAAGLFGFFQVGDIRDIPIEDGFIDFANDRGCFHVLSPTDFPKAVSEIHRVLRDDGLFLLRVFSEKETGGGPHAFTRVELEKLFIPKFEILEFWEGVFEGPRRPASYSLLMRKR